MPEDPRENYAEVWQSSADDLHYWHVKAANGEVVANGEGYAREEGAVERVHNLFPNMEVKMLGKQKRKGKGAPASEQHLGEMPAINPEDIIRS